MSWSENYLVKKVGSVWCLSVIRGIQRLKPCIPITLSVVLFSRLELEQEIEKLTQLCKPEAICISRTAEIYSWCLKVLHSLSMRIEAKDGL